VFIISEHSKIMNRAEEEHLLILACRAFETRTRLNAHPVEANEEYGQRGRPHLSYQADGCLQIGPRQLRFLAEAKSRFQPDTVGRLRTINQQAAEPVILVVPYVSDRQGEQLREYNIQYLDTAGNAYLNQADGSFLILAQGGREPLAEQPMQHRAFQPAGVQLLYHLLSEPALLQASYRAMAGRAQVALGSVSILLRGLQQLELLRDETGKRRWTDPAQVLRRWVDAYGEVVRPKLAAQRYRWLDAGVARRGWQDLVLGPDMAWGGEPAAHLLLDGYLLPEYFTLYSTAARGEVMRHLRLVPDAAGKVEVVRPMATTLKPARPQPLAVPPLLAYADLLLTADPRNREVAHLVHEHYLPYLA
jgi:hypothetical protein